MSDDPVASITPIHRPIRRVGIRPADRNVFIEEEAVSLTCPTDGVDIHYTLDGGDPTPDSPRYEEPIQLTGTTVLRARAVREGVTELPATHDGTHASAVSLAKYTKAEPIPAVDPDGGLERGATCEYYEGDWTDLYASFDGVDRVESGTADGLFDLDAVRTDGTFGVSYSGYLRIPETGVYSIHAPREIVHHDIESGYVLRVAVGQDGDGLREWYPSTRQHAFGTWSVALSGGYHPFRVDFVDYREGAHEVLNSPALEATFVWDDTTPDLRISGPSVDEEPVPDDWLWQSSR